MDKSHTDFLKECEAEIASLKERIAALEERLSAYTPEPEEDVPVPEEDAVDFTAESIGLADAPMASELTPEPVEPAAEELEPIEVGPEPIEIEPEPMVQPAPEPVADDTAGMAWRKDKPGLAVKNIRSGISLYDRALFIGTLFKEDYALYDATIADLNNLASLDQAVAYIKEHFPDWDLGSNVVYNFMMALRKKLG